MKKLRKLTVKQKNLLKKWSLEGNYFSWEDLSLGQMKMLESINDTEILPQEASRFLGDLWSKKQRDKPMWLR